MNTEQELRTLLIARSEQQDAPSVDLADLMARGRLKRRRRTTLQVAVTAAAVAVLGGGAFGLAQPDRTAPGPGPTAPSPTETDPILEDTTCRDRCLQSGTYRIPLGFDDDGRALSGALSIEARGWESDAFLHRVWRPSPGGVVMLSVYEPRAFAGPLPCDADLTRALAPDATVDDVARRLADLPQFDVAHGPTALPAFGHETLYLQIRSDRIRCNEANDPDPNSHAQYNLADIVGSNGEWSGDSDIDPGQPALIDLWVLDIGGQNLVVEARREGSPTPKLIEQLDQVRKSLEFVVQE